MNTYKLNTIIKSLLVAGYLGDGCITKSQNHVTYFMKVQHGGPQKEYAEWNAGLFGDFANKPRTTDRFFKGKPVQVVTFETKSHPFCNQLRNCYIDNKKQIKKWMMTYLSPLALTIWYLDDGSMMWRNKKRKDGTSYKYIGGCKISLGVLTDKSCKVLEEFLQSKYNIHLNIKDAYNKEYQKDYKCAYLNMENTRILFNLIKDLVPDCMRYKITLQPETPKGDDIVWSTRIDEGVEGEETTPRLEITESSI